MPVSASRPRFPVRFGTLAMGLLLPLAAVADHGTAIQLQQVDVEAEQTRQLERDAIDRQQSLTPGAVDTVDGDALRERPVNNLAEALRYVPGVAAESTTGGDDLRLSVRGSNLDGTDYDNNGVLLLQDGLPVTAADGNNHNRFLDADSSRFLTVARGANAVGYGASTLGGAINAVSRTALNSEANELTLQGGSHDMANGRLVLGGVTGDLDGLIAIDRKLMDGYRDHSKLRRNRVDGNLGWQASDRLEWRFFLTHVESDQQLTDALTRTQFKADPSQTSAASIQGNYQKNVTSDRVAGKATWYIDADSQLEWGLSYEAQSLFHPIVYSPFFSLLIDNDQRTTAAMAQYTRKTSAHTWQAGVQLAHTDVTGGNYNNLGGRKGSQQKSTDNSADNASLFLLDNWQFKPSWTLVYGAQGVHARRDVRTFTLASSSLQNPHGNFSSVNPRAGLIRALGDHAEAFASISRLYEAPTSYQLQDSLAGGNAVLDAMHGVVYEGGLRGRLKGQGMRPDWHWSLAVYRSYMKDEILAVEDPAAPGTYLSGNVDKTLHTGVELLLGANFRLPAGQHLKPLLSASWNNFRFDGDASFGNNTLPGAPAHRVNGELMWQLDDGFYIGPTFEISGARYVDFANNYRVSGYALVGLRAGIERPRWEVFAEARNLADKDYVGSVSVQTVAAANAAVLRPGAPLSAYAGARIRF